MSVNIRDIAKLAGVSVATVSKVINRKDGDISDKTRDKVLAVIQEHQYSPYSNIKIKTHAKNIGVLLPSLSVGVFPAIAQHLEQALRQKGYHMTVQTTEMQDVSQCAAALAAKNIDGMIVYHDGSPFSDTVAAKTVIIGTAAAGVQCRLQYEQAAHAAVKHLTDYNHAKIGLILGAYEHESITRGFLTALNESGLSLNPPLAAPTGGELDWQTVVDLIDGGITAIICGSAEIAAGLFHLAYTKHWSIPKDLSVVAIDSGGGCRFLCPECTYFSFDIASFARSAVKLMVASIAHRNQMGAAYTFEPVLYKLHSVALPRTFHGDGIVVVGTLNMDIFLHVEHLPESGETIMAKTIINLPGGKGANQAVGVGKLNGTAYIIGRVGNDQNGRELYGTLLRHNVNTDGLFFDNDAPTGRAFIAVDAGGNDTITVHGGANHQLDQEQFTKMSDVFDRCKYALLQMELSLDIVMFAITFCKAKGLRIVLKPSPAIELPEAYYRNIFLYVPNEKEARQLCPQSMDVQRQAAYFLQKGVENVIITLGERGCYFANANDAKYYPSAEFKTVDSTGASDCFISALTVFLAKGKTMDEAIVFANMAAGMSVTKYGVQNAMPEFDALKDYF